MFKSYSSFLRPLFLGFALVIAVKGFSQQDYLVKNVSKKSAEQYHHVKEEPKQVFSVLPGIVQKSAKLVIDAPCDGWATFELRDNSGEVVLEQQMAVEKGENIIPIFFISKLERGVYTSVLKIEDEVFFSKLVKG